MKVSRCIGGSQWFSVMIKQGSDDFMLRDQGRCVRHSLVAPVYLRHDADYDRRVSATDRADLAFQIVTI